MGASSFIVKQKGIYKNAQEAFIEAVKNAQYEDGHGGYTGTIAEKNSFKMIPVPKGQDPKVFAYECYGNSDGKFWDDKYGPAGCVEVTGHYLTDERGEIYFNKRNFHVYYFFGMAAE